MNEGTGDDTEQLLSMRELAARLRRHGLMRRSYQTLTIYCRDGKLNSRGRRVRLRCVTMNRVRYSTVAWFKEFLGKLTAS
jgi:hypothetical protein